jgi:N6-L-threonylcarbamoyladenine synthase
MIILAVETSCDETAAAVVRDGQTVLSSVISSQIDFHRKYGGIVPELASRKHVEVISPIIQEALDTAGVGFKELAAVAVTYGPGLIGSLIVGLSAAKAIAWALGKPLIGVNHLEGHIYANFLGGSGGNKREKEGGGGILLPTTPSSSLPIPQFPFICLLVSGGHTMIIKVNGHGQYETIGRTRDDAAGEAYDKVARFLKLGYPGGPVIDKLAKEGDPKAINFTRPMLNDGYDFSFSGLKTAVVNLVSRTEDRRLKTEDIAASFQQAVVDVLVEKTVRAALDHGCRTVTIAGGVSANSQLRQELKTKGETAGLNVSIPPFEYCTDNAAMIACAAYYRVTSDQLLVTDSAHSRLTLSPIASLKL